AQVQAFSFEERRRVKRFLMAWIAAHSCEMNVLKDVLSQLFEFCAGLNDVRVTGVVGDVNVLSGQRRAGADSVEKSIVSIVPIERTAIERLLSFHVHGSKAAAHFDRVHDAVEVKRRRDGEDR